MADQDVYQVLLDQGIPAAIARERADAAEKARKESEPGPEPDAKALEETIYPQGRFHPPDPGPAEDAPPVYDKKVFEDLKARGYNEAFCMEVAQRGFTVEHARDVGEEHDLISHVYEKSGAKR